MAAVAAGPLAIFCGGKHAHANRTARCDVYNASSGGWVTAPNVSLDSPRSMVTAVAAGDLIFFAGGEYAEDEKNQSSDECSDTVQVSC